MSRPSKVLLSSRKPARMILTSEGYAFSIAGVHGVGKTTVLQLMEDHLAEYPEIRFFAERSTVNPPVPFGSKDKQIAFRSEIHYNQQMILRNEEVKQFLYGHREHIAIQDRTPYSTLIYAQALGLPALDYQLLADTFWAVSWVEDFIIYLYAKPKTISERIYRRGSLDQERKQWNEEDQDYLMRVLAKYEEMWKNLGLEKKNRLIRIQTDDLSPNEVMEKIIAIIEERTGHVLHGLPKQLSSQKTLVSWFQKPDPH